jgi:hypothetical protein
MRTADQVWDGTDEAWREAFRQGWEAVRSGNIGVGACASTLDGEIIHAARNRVSDRDGPLGEVFGSSVAHQLDHLLTMEVDRALAAVWPRIQPLLQPTRS